MPSAVFAVDANLFCYYSAAFRRKYKLLFRGNQIAPLNVSVPSFCAGMPYMGG